MIIECSNCGKEFNKSPSKIKEKNYCCRNCVHESQTVFIDVECGCCGKPLKRKPHELKSSKSGKLFCSKSCAVSKNNELRRDENHPNWNGGNASGYYRRKGLRESNGQCEVCGYDKVSEILQVHHIDGNRTNNSSDNLQILCPTCHCEIHWGPNGTERKQSEV